MLIGSERVRCSRTLLAVILTAIALAVASTCSESNSDRQSLPPAMDELAIAESLYASNQYDSAATRLERTLAALSGTKRLGDHQTIVSGLLLLADCYVATEEYERADSAYGAADAILAAFHEPDSLRAFAMLQWGYALDLQRRNTSAESLFVEALTLLERSYGAGHACTELAYEALSGFYLIRNDPDKHIQYAEPYLRIRLRATGACDSAVLSLARELLRSYSLTNQADKPLRLLELVVGTSTCQDSTNAKALMYLTWMLGGILKEQREFPRACSVLERSLDGAEVHYSDHSDSLLGYLNRYAICLVEMGDHAAAEPICRRIVEISSIHVGPSSRQTLEYRLNLGNVLMNLRRLQEAGTVLRDALSDASLAVEADSLALVDYLFQYGWLLIVLERADEAEPHLRRALRIAESECEPDDVRLISPLRGLAWLEHHAGNEDLAAQLEARVDSIAGKLSEN